MISSPYILDVYKFLRDFDAGYSCWSGIPDKPINLSTPVKRLPANLINPAMCKLTYWSLSGSHLNHTVGHIPCIVCRTIVKSCNTLLHPQAHSRDTTWARFVGTTWVSRGACAYHVTYFLESCQLEPWKYFSRLENVLLLCLPIRSAFCLPYHERRFFWPKNSYWPTEFQRTRLK